MKTYFTFMKESHTLYHSSYTDAINAALQKHSDLNVSDEDRDTHIAMGPRKPAEGETVKHHIPATDKNGDKHMIHIQVYNKGGNKPFELNTYSSKKGVSFSSVSKKKVAEENVDVSEGLGDRYTNDPIGNFSGLKTYAKKLGPKHIDYHDLMVAASHMAFGNSAHLKKHLNAMDTDVRDKIKEYMKEEVEQIDEVSKDLAGRYIKAAKYNQIYKVGREGRHYAGKRIDYQNREKGIDTAIKKLTGQVKVPATNEESDYIGYNFGGQFKDSSEWENAAKKRGLVVKVSTHPSGEVIKYQIAKDKSGNNRGHFDHGTKSGRLTIDEALGTIKNMKAASKFSSSNVSDMIRGEKARKAGMAKVSTTKDIGYKVVDVGPGQKETVRKMHNFKEEAQQVYEEHMSEKDAESLAQRHVDAAISAKKSGNLAGYYAHAEASNYIRDKILTHTYSPKGIPSVKIRSTAKKLFRESDLAEKEEMEINELDRGGIISRYIRKAGPGGSENFPKRKKGVDLALLKKWGDKGYGLPEPKVKAVQREEVEPLAEISAALVRRSSRLAMDE